MLRMVLYCIHQYAATIRSTTPLTPDAVSQTASIAMSDIDGLLNIQPFSFLTSLHALFSGGVTLASSQRMACQLVGCGAILRRRKRRGSGPAAAFQSVSLWHETSGDIFSSSSPVLFLFVISLAPVSESSINCRPICTRNHPFSDGSRTTREKENLLFCLSHFSRYVGTLVLHVCFNSRLCLIIPITSKSLESCG